MGSLLQNTVFGRTKRTFVSTWRTSNTSTGSSTATQIKLPLTSTGTYNFRVDWGDGLADTITTWNQIQTTHNYAVAGDYTIKITGTCTGWQFNNTGDRLKILSISSWGKLKLGTNQGGCFFGCANLNLVDVSDILDLTGLTSFSNIFANCTSLTTVNRINEWDTSSIASTNGMFQNCSNFNQNLGALNVSSVTSFNLMFSNCTTFNNGETPDINNWVLHTNGSLIMIQLFLNCTNFNQPVGNWNTIAVTRVQEMFGGCTKFDQNLGAWDVSNITDFSAFLSRASAFNNGGSSAINNWVLKSTGTITMVSTFYACKSFNQPIGNWNTERVNLMNSMFEQCTKFNQDLSTWNVSNVTTMTRMFLLASAFNQNLGVWNVSSVTDFTSMFSSATNFNNGRSPDINNWVLKTTGAVTMNSMFLSANSFNQNIGAWNVSNVVDMQQMFNQALSFNNGGNPDINNWNPVNVTTMVAMFRQTPFNQPIGSWNVSSVTKFGDNSFLGMFYSNSVFNQNIGAWNVSNVADFTCMFQYATLFNNGGSADINNWAIKTTGSVTMNSMFLRANSFNQPVGNWNTIAVTNMAAMFSFALVFNQNISSWNVSNVVTFEEMFRNSSLFNNGGSPDINNWSIKTTGTVNMRGMYAVYSNGIYSFNQPIGNWNTTAVTNMTGMFSSSGGANPFNQNIGNWNVSNVINFIDFMFGKTPKTLSTSNLDAIYNGWASRTVKTPITITFGTAKRTSASDTGKSILTASPNNWVITDGGI